MTSNLNESTDIHSSDEEQELLINSSTESLPPRKTWKFVSIVTLLAIIVVFMVSGFNGNIFESRLELAKRGALRYSSLFEHEKVALFEHYKTTFNRQYSSFTEENNRLSNFHDYLDMVDQRNDEEKLRGGSAIHGITKYADMSQDEFRRTLGYVKPKERKMTYKMATLDDYKNIPVKTETLDSDGTKSWVGELTTPIKDQGMCGGCWAFSASSQLESDAIRAGYLTLDDILSAQQIISCDPYSYGCEGGSTESAYYYIYQTGGLARATVVPYSSSMYMASRSSGQCFTPAKSEFPVTVDDYYVLDTEETMKAHILTTGPLSICLDATNWATYMGGIMTTCGSEINHCVQLVGVNTEEGYWLVRNSWGTGWGEEGYIKLAYGQNTCGITADPSYLKVLPVDA